MSRSNGRHVLMLAAFCTAIVGVLSGQSPARTASYTTEQAQAGRAAYERSCASCHLPTLLGSFEAPPLVGETFMNVWRTRTTGDLLNVMKTSMPPGSEGSLGDAAYTSIIAYLLESNGVAPGTQPLSGA